MIINSSKQWGGNERWSVETANALIKNGHQVHFGLRSPILENKLSGNIFKHNLKLAHEFNFAAYFELNKILKKYKIDVIIPTKRKEYVIAGICGKMLSVPVWFRLGIVRPIPKHKILQRLIYGKLPTGIICNSQQIKQQMMNDGIIDEEKIHVVYNGYSFSEMTNDSVSQQGNQFVFASAGRLTSQKGYDVLLEAVKLLRRQESNFVVKIAGKGPELENYQYYIKSNGLQKYVKFDGFIHDIREYFIQADAVLIPSRNEGIPNVLMEAWSVKKPVIASNSAGIPEAITHQHNGVLTDLNSHDLAIAMRSMIHQYEKNNNLGANGYRTLNTRFTLKRCINDLETILNYNISKGNRYEEVTV